MSIDALHWFFNAILVLLAIRVIQGYMPKDSSFARALSYLFH